MRRFVAAHVALLVLVSFSAVSVAAKDQWIRVQSPNFFLVGNDSEKDMKRVALKFEQFREAFARILPKVKLNSSVPTRVVVFKSDNSFKPFKPLYQGKPASLSGFYQKGLDVNHICLTSEQSEERPFATIFHEYVHQLTGDNVRALPLWFREGIAEYYTTFEATHGDRQVALGKPIAGHIYFLRENKFLPLSKLFSVDHNSPEYNERQKQGVFYAESWALVHYLMTGDNGKHHPKLVQYLNLLASGVSLEESFAKAFQTDYAKLERDLQKYIQRNSYGYTSYELEKKLSVEEPVSAIPLSDAEVSFYLGDLLLHTQRLEDAEKHLKQSLEADPSFGPALASMGTLRLRQAQWPEARDYFQKAVAADSGNYLAHYYYADLLLRVGDEGDTPSSSSEEKHHAVQSEAKKAIELAPWFVESYRLLAYAANTTGEDLPATVALLKKAQAYAPGREDLRLDQARLHLRMDDYAAARSLLDPIARHSTEPRLKQEAEMVLAQLQAFDEQRQLVETARAQGVVIPADEEDPDDTVPTSEVPKMRRRSKGNPSPEPAPELELRPAKGDKAAGVLTRIECLDEGVVFLVKSGSKTLRLHAADPEQILLYNEGGANLGTISMTCGPLSPPSPIVATYRASTQTSPPYDGTLLSVLFVNR
jgi:tetratricopeptide (TPR) repeat protein